MDWPFIEVRIHGVSGTSAMDLLQARPTAADRDATTDLTKPADTAGWTRAFRWSSLTSGRPSSALWILLLPYMLANVVGWALPPRASDTRHRIDVALTRGVGGFLTMIFSLVTAYGFIVVGGYSAFGLSWGNDPALGVTLGSIVSLGSIGLVWWLTKSRDRGLTPVVADPTTPETERDWDLMRRAHLGIGAGSTLWLLAVTAEEAFPETSTNGWAAVGLGVALAAIALLAVSAFWTGPALAGITGVAAVVPGLGVVWFATSLWLSATDAVRPESLSTTGEPLSSTVVWFTGFALGLVAAAWSGQHRLASATVATLLSVGGAAGAAVGAATIQVTSRPTGAEAPRSIGIIAEGFLLGLLLLVLFVLVLFIRGHAAVPEGPNRGWRAFVSLIDAPGALLHGIPTVITAVSFGVFVTIDVRPSVDVFEVGARIVFPLIVLAAVYLARSRIRVALGIGLVGLLVYVVTDALFEDFESLAVTGALVLPAGLIGTRVFNGYRDADTRRGLAIAWDVGSYFPAVFHPFAPPPYGATAVESLKTVLERLGRDHGPVVVTAHSQGSVVASEAVLRVDSPVALCTVGSPLGTLYRPLFPAHFSDERNQAVKAAVSRWVNLWRDDDPVGGRILPDVDHPEMDDPRGRIHAAYWYRDESEYNDTLGDLLRSLEVDDADIPSRYQ